MHLQRALVSPISGAEALLRDIGYAIRLVSVLGDVRILDLVLRLASATRVQPGIDVVFVSLSPGAACRPPIAVICQQAALQDRTSAHSSA